MKFIICDDNKEFAKLLKNKITELSPDCSVRIFNTLEELNFKLPDIAEDISAVFLDIQQADGNGIEAGVKIAEKYPHIKLIYVTGFGAEFAQSIFVGPSKATPVAFLTKPLQIEYLRNALKKVSDNSNRTESYIAVKTDSGSELIACSDILSVSGEGRKVIIETSAKNYHIYSTLKATVSRLPDYFVRCHRSYVINTRRIERIDGWNSVIMKNGSSYPIGRTYKASLRRIITENY